VVRQEAIIAIKIRSYHRDPFLCFVPRRSIGGAISDGGADI
jgi:hypothetical protein